ncbi:MAG: N-formylglutamate amidohydrolase [Bacteriovoracaceae bacterium]|nr:N-formylglutamate amidohydrolase [Bacteriovoracaceae bacterium]
MFQSDAPAKKPLFTFHPPLTDKPVGLVSIPHSGEDVPDEFLNYLAADINVMREDVDFKVDELVDIEALQKAGIGVLVAHVHRVCVDLNRSPEQSVLFWQVNTKGVPLVKKNPTDQERSDFIQRYHAPFFEIYSSLIRDLERRLKGAVPVVDLHSMPSRATAYHMKQNPNQRQERADFCVSDQRGKTCSEEYIKWFTHSLTQFGHEAVINDPYIGGYVTTFVDGFRTNNIQIEINRRIYMDEVKKVLIPEKAPQIKELLTRVLSEGLAKYSA